MSLNRQQKSWLHLETLEDRQLPTCTFTVVGGTLTILGDDNPNNVQITDNGSNAADNLAVTCDGVGLVLPSVNLSIINVNTFDGNDTVTYSQTNNQKNNRKITVVLGPEDDDGDDDDNFQATLPKDIRPNRTLTMKVFGGEDDDNINVNARGFGIPAGARFNLTLDGQDDDDNIGVKYKDTVIGKIVYNGFGGDGEDNMFADFVAFDGGGGAEGGGGQGAVGPSTGRIVANLYGQDDDDAIVLLMRKTGASTSPLNGFADGGDDDNSLIRTPNVLFTNFDSVTTINP